jgi:hypothetical protein
MYATIRYFNYRKEVSFTILKTFNSFKNADKYALKCAQDDFGEKNVIEGVSEQWVYVNGEIEGYTRGDGYDQFVYTVIEIPEAEDESEYEYESDSEDESELNIKKQENGKYEWGFDLTDFNDDEERETGSMKFQELLDIFNLKLSKESSGFIWVNTDDLWSTNKDALMLVTGNNPLTGEYTLNPYSGERDRQNEKGYLSYVGVTCNSRETLQHFIEEFRNRASYIKGESNVREYI